MIALNYALILEEWNDSSSENDITQKKQCIFIHENEIFYNDCVNLFFHIKVTEPPLYFYKQCHIHLL